MHEAIQIGEVSRTASEAVARIQGVTARDVEQFWRVVESISKEVFVRIC